MNLNIFGVLGGIFLIIVVTFVGVLFYNLVTEDLIEPVYTNVTQIVNGSSVFSSQTQDNINDLKSWYDINFTLPFNLLFGAILLFYFLGIGYYAITSPSLSNFNFGIYLVGSTIFSGLIIAFFKDVLVWFSNNYILNLFTQDLQLLSWVVTNFGELVLFSFMLFLILNKAKEFIYERIEQDDFNTGGDFE